MLHCNFCNCFCRDVTTAVRSQPRRDKTGDVSRCGCLLPLPALTAFCADFTEGPNERNENHKHSASLYVTERHPAQRSRQVVPSTRHYYGTRRFITVLTKLFHCTLLNPFPTFTISAVTLCSKLRPHHPRRLSRRTVPDQNCVAIINP